VLLFELAVFPFDAFGAEISFCPQQSLNGGLILGRIPIPRFGNIVLPHGRAYFKHNMVEVTAVPEYEFDREEVLSGPILKCWSNISGKTATIDGIAYFQEGEWIKYVDDEKLPDKVITSHGNYSGQITAMKNGFIVVKSEFGASNQISIADIQRIVSPRAFAFSLSVEAFLSVPQGQPFYGETKQVTMSPTFRMIALSTIKNDPLMRSDGDVSSKKLTALWVGLSGIELAQFVPLAILEGPIRRQYVRQYHSRINQYEQDSNLQTTDGLLYNVSAY
jgi:hypothetical protein